MFDDFFAYCFLGGSHTVEDVLDVMNNITKENSGELIVDQVITNYATYYQNYFETDKFGTDEKEFKDCIQDFILLSEWLESDHNWLSTLTIGLRLISGKFEELNPNQHDTKI